MRIISLICLSLGFALFALPISAQNETPSHGLPPLYSGIPDAPVKIEVFYDLQCSACANLHPILMNAEKKVRPDLLIIFRHFPLRVPAHDKAFMAARIVEAANVQRKGLPMLDLILKNQKSWATSKRAKAIFFGYAVRLKLNMAQFREDYEGGEIIYRIFDDLIKAKFLAMFPTIVRAVVIS